MTFMMDKDYDDLNTKVSIITPLYNSEKFLQNTIESVLNQTYRNWEWIIVDDCSTDSSKKIIEKYTCKDKRIKYFLLESNSGAAVARNFGLRNSKGRFIAYLDSDDLWDQEKLEEQVEFMCKYNYEFTCTDYEVIDEEGNLKNKIVHMPHEINYNLYLRNTIIQTVGVMIDISIIDKELLYMPLIRRRQDAATWCKILKKGFNCYGFNRKLASYRRVSTSLSSNKFKAVKGTWYLYRNIEKLSLIKSIHSFLGYAWNACKKRIYIFDKMRLKVKI